MSALSLPQRLKRRALMVRHLSAQQRRDLATSRGAARVEVVRAIIAQRLAATPNSPLRAPGLVTVAFDPRDPGSVTQLPAWVVRDILDMLRLINAIRATRALAPLSVVQLYAAEAAAAESAGNYRDAYLAACVQLANPRRPRARAPKATAAPTPETQAPAVAALPAQTTALQCDDATTSTTTSARSMATTSATTLTTAPDIRPELVAARLAPAPGSVDGATDTQESPAQPLLTPVA